MEHKANWLGWCTSIWYGIVRDGICVTLCCFSHPQGLKCQKGMYYYMNLCVLNATNASSTSLCILQARRWGFFNLLEGLQGFFAICSLLMCLNF